MRRTRLSIRKRQRAVAAPVGPAARRRRFPQMLGVVVTALHAEGLAVAAVTVSLVTVAVGMVAAARYAVAVVAMLVAATPWRSSSCRDSDAVRSSCR